MLEIKNIHARIGDKEILKGIDLYIGPGEVHAVMGPNGAGKSTLSAVLTGRPDYEVTEGSILYKGEDLLSKTPESTLSAVLTGRPDYEVTEGSILYKGEDLLSKTPEERAWAGLFLSFQYPVEIPGVTITAFMKAAVNAKRKAQGLPELKAGDFLRLMKEKMALVQMKPEFAKREVNVGFSGGEKKRNEIFQLLRR